MTGTYQDYRAALGNYESSDRWDYVNPIGHAGFYQVVESSLRMIGYYDYDGTSAVDWNGGWTDKARAEGINSLQDFLANHAFQDKALTEYYQYLWNTNFEGSNLKEFIGQTIGGITITTSSLFAGSHLVGANGVEAFLRSGGVTVPNDPFGTTVSNYLSKFGGYDMTPVTGTDTSSPPEVVAVPPVPTPDTSSPPEVVAVPPVPTPDTSSPPEVVAVPPISVPAGQALEGTEDHDALFGGRLDDTISGKNGNDWMNGGSGNDHLWGDQGTDMFAFAGQFGDDTIGDFQAGAESGHDFITFTPDLFASFDDMMSNTTDTADGALITSDNGSVLVKGVLKSTLVEADFYFL